MTKECARNWTPTAFAVVRREDSGGVMEPARVKCRELDACEAPCSRRSRERPVRGHRRIGKLRRHFNLVYMVTNRL